MKENLSAVHKTNENENKHEHKQPIRRVKNGSLKAIVFSCFVEMRRECSILFLHPAEHLANRRKKPRNKISA